MYTCPEPIANLGDVNFLEYGGRLVFSGDSEDITPYMEVIEPPPEDCFAEGEEKTWMVYRFDLDLLRIVEQDNTLFLVPGEWDQTWPKALSSYDEWFHKGLAEIADFIGTTAAELREAFVSPDPIKRAWAWCAIGDHDGFDNLDGYPLTLTEHEVFTRYNQECECALCQG